MFLDLDLGLEAVDHVKISRLGLALEEAITKAREKNKPNVKEIAKIISHFTNGKFKGSLKEGYIAAILTENGLNGNVLLEFPGNWINEPKKRDLGKVLNIGIDLKSGKFTGDTNEFPFTLYFGKGWFSKDSGTTVKEAVAAILHEVGHAMSYIEYLNYIFVSNFLLEDFAERIISVKDKDKRMAIVKDVADKNNRPSIIDEAIENVKTKEQAQLVLISGMMNEKVYWSGSKAYTWRNWEMLADQYTVRQGYGLHLATALNKIYFSKTQSVLMSILVSYVQLYFLPLFIVISLFSKTDTDTEYDSPKRRLEVIRNGIVGRLKEDWVTKEDRKILLSEIDAMGKAINDAPPDVLAIVNFINSYIGPWKNRDRKHINAQKLLEDFAATKLTVAANRLEQLKG